jgi:hypothetical protein
MNWLQEQQSRLITRFSINQLLASNGKLQRLERSALNQQFLIGRDLCQYACIDLGNVQKSKRIQALVQKIKLLSFWGDPAFTVAWHGAVAQVWFWSASEVDTLLRSEGQNIGSLIHKPEFLSEVMFWGKPKEDGLYLYNANHGVDAQLWKQGLLVASHWFPSAPDASQMQRFARAQGMPGVASELQPLEPSFLEKAWDGVTFSFFDHLFDRRSQALIYIGAFSFLIASLQLTSVIRWYNETSLIKQQTEELSRSAEPLLAARSSARNAQQDVREIANLFGLPDPLSIQQSVQRAFPGNLKVELHTWERNIDQIDMVVKGEISDTLSLVRAFEQAGFDNVRVEPLPENKQYRIRLRIKTASYGVSNEGQG